MKVYAMFFAFVVIVVGAYLDIVWLSVLGLALVGLFAILVPNQKRLPNNSESYCPPTVFRK